MSWDLKKETYKSRLTKILVRPDSIAPRPGDRIWLGKKAHIVRAIGHTPEGIEIYMLPIQLHRKKYGWPKK